MLLDEMEADVISPRGKMLHHIHFFHDLFGHLEQANGTSPLRWKQSGREFIIESRLRHHWPQYLEQKSFQSFKNLLIKCGFLHYIDSKASHDIFFHEHFMHGFPQRYISFANEHKSSTMLSEAIKSPKANLPVKRKLEWPQVQFNDTLKPLEVRFHIPEKDKELSGTSLVTSCVTIACSLESDTTSNYHMTPQEKISPAKTKTKSSASSNTTTSLHSLHGHHFDRFNMKWDLESDYIDNSTPGRIGDLSLSSISCRKLDFEIVPESEVSFQSSLDLSDSDCVSQWAAYFS
jgi:hypothetical protein